MTDFSLLTLTREVLAGSNSEDREQIVKEIERRIPPELAGEALRQALPAFVHQAQSPRWPPAGGKRPSGRSSKVAGIRDAWRRYLDGRYTVEDGSLRKLGDFGEADLLFAADGLEAKARKHAARAAAMKSLAVALGEHDVKLVRDLPADFLAEFFGAPA